VNDTDQIFNRRARSREVYRDKVKTKTKKQKKEAVKTVVRGF